MPLTPLHPPSRARRERPDCHDPHSTRALSPQSHTRRAVFLTRAILRARKIVAGLEYGMTYPEIDPFSTPLPPDAPALAHRLAELARTLAQHADADDNSGNWPAHALDAIAAADGWRWVLPRESGGLALTGAELLLSYEAVARGSLAAALILTQRDAAADLIARGENAQLKSRLLPEYAAAGRFTSVGISQITTSKGAGRPKLIAEPRGDGFVLDGFMPWVTSAEHCDEIVTAAVTADGRQLVAAIPCDAAGVVIEPPLRLLALDASRTCRVRCEGVRIGRESVIRGPAESVLSQRGPVKPFVVSAVGIGHAGAMLQELAPLRARSAEELTGLINDAAAAHEALRSGLLTVAGRVDPEDVPQAKTSYRVRVNALVNRLAVMLMTAAKGSGYVRPSRVERLVREAMFFNVWSAPEDVQVGTVRDIWGPTAL